MSTYVSAEASFLPLLNLHSRYDLADDVSELNLDSFEMAVEDVGGAHGRALRTLHVVNSDVERNQEGVFHCLHPLSHFLDLESHHDRPAMRCKLIGWFTILADKGKVNRTNAPLNAFLGSIRRNLSSRYHKVELRHIEKGILESCLSLPLRITTFVDIIRSGIEQVPRVLLIFVPRFALLRRWARFSRNITTTAEAKGIISKELDLREDIVLFL